MALRQHQQYDFRGLRVRTIQLVLQQLAMPDLSAGVDGSVSLLADHITGFRPCEAQTTVQLVLDAFRNGMGTVLTLLPGLLMAWQTPAGLSSSIAAFSCACSMPLNVTA
jgi:hypothetical protein